MVAKNDITGDNIATRTGDASSKEKFDNNFDNIFRKKVPLSPELEELQEDEDEIRMNIVGQNGNVGYSEEDM
jgi:hypothetical protein